MVLLDALRTRLLPTILKFTIVGMFNGEQALTVDLIPRSKTKIINKLLNLNFFIYIFLINIT